MASTPDLSRLVSVIMENPQLISEIAALADQSKASSGGEQIDEIHEDRRVEAPTEQMQANESISASAPEAKSYKRSHRKELLNAMKPYLSEHRRSALDSMSSIFDIIDVMIKKES